MTRRTIYLVAAATIGALATPAIAQTSYPYPQPYPQQGYGYPQQSYGYGQPGYGSSSIGQIIGQLLGNRYNVTDRTAVTQCASAVMSQAASQYGLYGRQGYGQNAYGQNGYGYPPQAYGQPGYGSMMRVTAITDVQRRANGLRVKGLIDSGVGYRGGYGQGSYNGGYSSGGYAGGDLSFRCNVDYRGAVTDIRISRNDRYRR